MRARTTRLRIAVVAAMAALGLAITGVTTVQASRDAEPDVYVYFTDASPLIKGNDVKAAGVKVGTIGSIEVEKGLAKVGLVLDDEVLPLHTDATARVRPVGLLGERYVDLDRGSPDSPALSDGGSIRPEQTTRATDLDEVLDVVDQPTGAALSFLLTTLGEGLQGRGKNADAAIKALAPALTDTDRLARILDEQNGVLVDLLESVEPVAEQVATGRGSQLDALLAATDSVLKTTAGKAAEMDQTLQRLPATLSEAEATLRVLAGAASATTPVLRGIRPTTDALRTLSTELRAFASAAKPALDSLDPVLEKSSELLEKARPVVRALSSLGPDMRTTARDGRRLSDEVFGNFRNVLDFVKYWALTTNGEDGLSHYFRAHEVITTEIATGLIPDSGGAKIPSAPVPSLGQPLENLLGGLGLGSLKEGGLLGGLLNRQPAEPSDDGALGLTSTQERSLLGYLIGGK